MNWTTYFIVVTAVTSLSLTWRMWLLDHPKFDAAVESIPVIGNGLVCGFCVPMWLTLVIVLAVNPLQDWVSPSPLFSNYAGLTILGWLSSATGVLFVRFLIVALFDGSGVLSHMHKTLHKNDNV
ncbi:MAG TPA: hypothetical protein VMU25_03060 [Candidatus Paceibacterota bacterium]|nr:hypothetical protein [Candidatus Paceibacterota bacterium]